MARPRPEKKRQKAKPVQPPLPGMPPPEPPGTTRVLPMQLQIGDRMTDSTGEWEVVGRPYTTNGGKNAHVRVQGEPAGRDRDDDVGCVREGQRETAMSQRTRRT